MTQPFFPTPEPDVANAIREEIRVFNGVAADLPSDDASRNLTAACESLTAWTEAGRTIDPRALRDDTYLPDASRYGCMGASITAADNAMRSMTYIAHVTTRNPETMRRMAQTCEIDTVRAIHDIQHRAALDTVQMPEGAVRFTPGEWRTWPESVRDPRTDRGLPATPPDQIPAAMKAWTQAFAVAEGKSDRWSGVPTCVRAAQAYAGLMAISPFPDGNGRCARTIGHGILREDAIAASGLHAMADRHRPRLNARLYDAIASGDQVEWARSFTKIATEGIDAIHRTLPQMREGVIALASHMGQNAGLDGRTRHKLALSMMQYPVDRPKVFAQRHNLDREATQEILKPLVRGGFLELGRINGQQVFVTKPSLEAARTLGRPEQDRYQDLSARARQSGGHNRDEPR